MEYGQEIIEIMGFKKIIKKSFLYRIYNRLFLQKYADSMLNESKGVDRKTIFENIYASNTWGGEKGTIYSGPGSHDNEIIKPYINVVNKFIRENGISKVVDIGCGDYYIGSHIECEEYLGCDIVDRVCEENKKKYGSSNIDFKQLDAVQDELPDGDICLIKEVLQHLSNDDILVILSKIKKYKYAIITECVTKEEFVLKYNIDKTPNCHTRVVAHSGVYLNKDPFNMKAEKLLVLDRKEEEEIISWLIVNE